MTYDVIWDGTASRIQGRYLFAESHPVTPVETPVVAHGMSILSAVKAAAMAFPDWFTLREMAEAASISPAQASTALGNLYRSGEVQRERKQVMRGRLSGTDRQRYRWISKGRGTEAAA